MAQRTGLRDSVLAALERNHSLKQEDLGADARLSGKGMTFETESWEIQGVGHLCIMRMKAFLGLMRMETAVIAPTGVDVPLFNLDWVKAFGTETQIAELYDTQLEPWPDECQAAFEFARAQYADLPDAPSGGARWYDGMSMVAKCAIWISAAILYACETSPVIFRFVNESGTDALLVVGMVVSVVGLVVETTADLQKNAAKKVNPHRFVDTGLFRIVRCPNYFGEMLFWAGMFIGGITIYSSALQWIVALAGYLGIIYVMFGGARRLEIRQSKSYGDDPEYQHYVKTTPIMIPLVPIYSVEKHKWLVA